MCGRKHLSDAAAGSYCDMLLHHTLDGLPTQPLNGTARLMRRTLRANGAILFQLMLMQSHVRAL